MIDDYTRRHQHVDRGWLVGSQVDVTGDGRHFDAVIVSSEFEGKSAVQRHQLVYSGLGEKMRADIHALSMRTVTPSESVPH